MLFQPTLTSVGIRPAQETDRVPLSNLFHFEPYIYRHLDWKRPLDWLGESPFLVAERKGRLVAALVCPPDPPGVVWIRAFAASNQVRVEEVWKVLWGRAQELLQEQAPLQIASLCSEKWMQKLLEGSGFRHTHSVVLLRWDASAVLLPPLCPHRPRVMVEDDLAQIVALDWMCFEPLWRNSHSALQIAFHQAIFATVVEAEDGSIIGYQISTPSPQGGHLARLAVHPQAQGIGIGYALVYDLLMRFLNQSNASGLQVTVNTQAENKASLSVYRRANFVPSGNYFPVYEYGR